MPIPTQITFRDIPPSEAIEAKVRQRAERLERFADRATSLHVIISAPHARSHGVHHKGQLYQFTLEMVMPRGDIVVSQGDSDKHQYEDVYVAMRDAFAALERRVHEHIEKLGH